MMSSPAAPTTDASGLAREAYALVQVDPRKAERIAEQALTLARDTRDADAHVAALHALAWAQHVEGDPRAIGTARVGIQVGLRHGNRRGVALLRRRLALSLAFEGETHAARREIEAALAELRGRDRAESEVFRVAIHRAAHSADPEAHRRVLAAATQALRRLRADGDELWQARLHFNRGMLLSDRGELASAENDLRRAHDLYLSAGAQAAAYEAAEALAELVLRRGDVVETLRTIDGLEPVLSANNVGLSWMRVTALIRARLLPEARVAAERHLALCRRTGRTDQAAGVLLDLASIAMLSGQPDEAAEFARRAVRSYAARSKPVDAARARIVCIRAHLGAGNLPRSTVRSGLDASHVLERAGWRSEALRARLVVARAALVTGLPRVAGEQIDRARPLGTRGDIFDRIELFQTRALYALSEGSTPKAQRLLRNGLRLLDEYRAALGAVELRVTASAIGQALSETGLRIAFGTGTPLEILAWADRLRANAVRLPPIRPPQDARLRAAQAELRRVALLRRRSDSNGGPVRGLAARQLELEEAVRARTRQMRGGGTAVSFRLRLPDATRALGARALVEYVELDGELRALTLVDGRTAVHELGPAGIADELDWLRFALGRLADRGVGKARRSAALASTAAAAEMLDSRLVRPLLPRVGGAPVVVVPTGALHAIPWGALPSLRGRPVVVAPSLSTWLDVSARPRSRRRKTALVAGPHLRYAATEVRTLAVGTDALVLHGAAATADATLRALDGAALAHVACHGRFRADSPLFSSLELADGPLTALELQRLRRPPEVLVLSACDLALSDRQPGDELLGLSAALLAMGTRTIVASVVPVPDAAARRLMLTFHRAVAAGASPAVALARAQANLRKGSEALAGFVCLGTG
jgi:tetratricopeptide (TPR) repeat protein